MTEILKHELRRVYWETTAGCNLRCTHCRRTDVLAKGSPDELSTEEGRRFIDELASLGKPVLIFSGGEPLFRRDIFDLISHAKNAGLPVALSTNGTLVDEKTARRIRECGVYYASISLDGARPATHDVFRGGGNFDRALRGFRHLREAGIKVQINFTVTRQNVGEMEEMYQWVASLGAAALYLFLLVPVGCGVEIADSQMLDTREVDRWLEWVHGKDKQGSLPVKAICAPHYFRIERELAEEGDKAGARGSESRRGCLAGIHMAFVSHKGDVFPCGYLPVPAGNIRQSPFQAVWEGSPTFQKLRDPALLEGRCGLCPYKVVCGGCRARGYYARQDILAEEPYCVYEPAAV